MVKNTNSHILGLLGYRTFFRRKKKDKGSEAQARLEEAEEELSPVADHFGKRKVEGNAMRMRMRMV